MVSCMKRFFLILGLLLALPLAAVESETLAQRTLRQIAERRPSTLGEMQAIQGMDDLKTDRFGTAFLEVLREG